MYTKYRNVYMGVLTVAHQVSTWLSDRFISFARPKSDTFALKLSSNKMFWGLMSRWTILSSQSWCKYASPFAVPIAIPNRVLQSRNLVDFGSSVNNHWSREPLTCYQQDLKLGYISTMTRSFSLFKEKTASCSFWAHWQFFVNKENLGPRWQLYVAPARAKTLLRSTNLSSWFGNISSFKIENSMKFYGNGTN